MNKRKLSLVVVLGASGFAAAATSQIVLRNGSIERGQGAVDVPRGAYALLQRVGSEGYAEFDRAGITSMRGHFKLRKRLGTEKNELGAVKEALRADDVFAGFRADDYAEEFATKSGGSDLRRLSRSMKGAKLYRGEVVVVSRGEEMSEFYGAPAVEPTQSAHARSQSDMAAAARNLYGSDIRILQLDKSFFNPYLLDKEKVNQTVPSWTLRFDHGTGTQAAEAVLDDGNGSALFFDDFRRDLLNRSVWNGVDANGSVSSSSATRNEGGAASTNAVVNEAYNQMGIWYSHFARYSRDGFDGAGGPMWAFVNLSTLTGFDGASIACPNAFNSVLTGQASNGKTVFVSASKFCNGLAVPDVFMHEQSHALVTTTANFTYSTSLGKALHEGYADAFSYLLTQDWKIGEATPAGTMRYADKPSKDGSSIDNWSAYTSGLNGYRAAGLVTHPGYLMALGGAGAGGDAVIGRGYAITSDLYYGTLLRLVANSTLLDWAKVFVAQAKAGFSYGPRSTACDALMAVRSVGLQAGIATDVCTDKRKNMSVLMTDAF